MGLRLTRFSMVVTLVVVIGALARNVDAGGVTLHTSAQVGVRCPHALAPGNDVAQGVLTAAETAIPRLYPGKSHVSYHISLLNSLARGSYAFGNDVYRQIAIHQCGQTDADRSWIVFVEFPKLSFSESMYGGQLYLARTAAGWRVYFRFH